MNANDILFRCSSLAYIMTDPKNKNETISETCKTHLVDLFVSRKYGRNDDVFNKYTLKGQMVEEDSLTLYSRYKKEFFKKNDQRLFNKHISGTPDIILKSDVRDIKSSWDIYTFFRNNFQKLNKMYYWQLQGYMDVAEKDHAALAYCLINTPQILINDEKRKLMWKMGVIDDSDKTYEEACAELDKLMIYDDIPLFERVIEIPITRNQADIDRMHDRVEQCREYMDKHLFKVSEASV